MSERVLVLLEGLKTRVSEGAIRDLSAVEEINFFSINTTSAVFFLCIVYYVLGVLPSVCPEERKVFLFFLLCVCE